MVIRQQCPTIYGYLTTSLNNINNIASIYGHQTTSLPYMVIRQQHRQHIWSSDTSHYPVSCNWCAHTTPHIVSIPSMYTTHTHARTHAHTHTHTHGEFHTGIQYITATHPKATAAAIATPRAADLPRPLDAVKATVVRSVFSEMASTNCNTAFA